MIKAEGLTLVYGSGTVAARDVSFEIGKGEIAGFAGPNGAGKTSVIKMLTGIMKPTEGRAEIAGYDIVTDAMEAKRRFAYISDNPDILVQLTGAEYIDFIADIYGVDKATRQERAGAMAKRFGIGDKLNTSMREYSHGMRQKLMIIAALVHEPEVWILDEPMTGLDPAAAYELKLMMKEHAARGNSVLFSTHVLEVAEKLCDRILIIDRGSLVYNGTVDGILEENEGLDLEQIFVKMTSGDLRE
ncbi:ABC-2 type transport system ATP-binding protein [Ruminococcaceae bacterium YRB3002]|nr:ABC-2 type transport system ATP-binding protein [Ruminococcaceae bacterium YRB3002]